MLSNASLTFYRSKEYSKNNPSRLKAASYFDGQLLVQPLLIIQTEGMFPVECIVSRDHRAWVRLAPYDDLITTDLPCLTSHNMANLKQLKKDTVIPIRRDQFAHIEGSIHSDKIKATRYECISVKSDTTFVLLRCNETKNDNGFRFLKNTESLNARIGGSFIPAVVFSGPSQKLKEYEIPIDFWKTFNLSRFVHFSPDNEITVSNGHSILLGFLMNSTGNIQKHYRHEKYFRTTKHSKNGVSQQHIIMAFLSASHHHKGHPVSISNTELLHALPRTRAALTDNSTNLDDEEPKWTIVVVSISVAGTTAFLIILIFLLVLCLRRERKAVTDEETKDRRNQYQFESLKIPSREPSLSSVWG